MFYGADFAVFGSARKFYRYEGMGKMRPVHLRLVFLR